MHLQPELGDHSGFGIHQANEPRGALLQSGDLTRKEIAMSRQVILGLAAATLVGITLVPDNALAHYGGRLHAVRVCDAADYRGWNPFSRDAGLRGYPGPHYGCDCYRAANRRATCRFY
jgi:hypothetical protein